NILSKHESSESRVILLEETYLQLDELSIRQDDLFRQGIRCAEHGLYRAAHIMSWSACIDFVEELMIKDNFQKLKKVRQKWKADSISDLRENYPESQIIDAMKVAGYISKNDSKALHGL